MRVAARSWPLWVLLLAGCASHSPTVSSPEDAHALIEQLLPRGVSDRQGWVNDIFNGFTLQGLDPTRERVCAVMAVTEQESGWQVNPVIPGLGGIARKEIDQRAEHAGVPLMMVHGALNLSSRGGRTYAERIAAARTEKDLSDIYEDFIGSVPLGHRLFDSYNPVRTRGPMQVNVAFANSYAATRTYPYPVKVSIADELFSRRGSVYFGIAHLFAYRAPYESNLYRFADFNAGQYASRNAAFQNAVSAATGTQVVPDGALLPHDTAVVGATEAALAQIAGKLNLSEESIHAALEQGKTQDFERSALYRRVFELARNARGGPLPYASIPRIQLHGPKISRVLTTDWYAHRVDGRYNSCLRRAPS